MARGQISLADWLLTLHRLGPVDEHVRHEISRALGIEAPTLALPPRLEGIWDRQRAPTVPKPSLRSPLPGRLETEPRPRPPRPREPVVGMGSPVTTRLVPDNDPASVAAPPAWLQSVPELWPLERPRSKAPAIAPLLPPRQVRAILGAALARPVAEGTLDWSRVVAMIASGKPLRHLPRHRVATLRHGVQLLMDASESMNPYRADIQDMKDRVERVVGRPLLSVARFRGSPASGMVSRGTRRGSPWESPARGRPILVLSDLGIGAPIGSRDRAPLEQWLDFARQARRNDSPVVVLVPFEAARWPHRLAAALHLMHWDRATRVGDVFRGLRRSLWSRHRP